jgi:hypothetical protein
MSLMEQCWEMGSELKGMGMMDGPPLFLPLPVLFFI